MRSAVVVTGVGVKLGRNLRVVQLMVLLPLMVVMLLTLKLIVPGHHMFPLIELMKFINTIKTECLILNQIQFKYYSKILIL